MLFDAMKPSDFFKCKKCGDCCKGYGGTFLTERDIDVIADYIQVDPVHFIDKYCQMSGGKPILAQGRNGYCIFWDKLCSIHPVRPRMCKAWPFIKSVLADIENWHIMAALCPGIRTDAPDSMIEKCVRIELSKAYSD